MLQALISPLSSLVGTWLQGRVDKSKAEAKVFETEATSAMLNERSLTDQMGGSWKDEFWSLHQYKCKICNAIHQVCVPKEKGETNEKKVTENVGNF